MSNLTLLLISTLILTGCAPALPPRPPESYGDGADKVVGSDAGAKLIIDGFNRTAEKSSNPDITRPKLIQVVPPVMPKYALFNNIQGAVYFSYVIQEDGSVSNLVITSSPHISLSNEILRAVIKWKFIPSKSNGKSIKTNAHGSFDFRLEN